MNLKRNSNRSTSGLRITKWRVFEPHTPNRTAYATPSPAGATSATSMPLYASEPPSRYQYHPSHPTWPPPATTCSVILIRR
ncbi:hypothetical protein BV22DRAFT_835381 [Leucogyrophana mollusca]|uniref:Uncharacterized protein n=1 Tax=Leucogyrophana mollusca TaxID=85980 RepID=A0ACB8B3H7_9AGAM|nr:hypothetical protein BV22DRAFT_835381 [Leucogyrophana mollusca]